VLVAPVRAPVWLDTGGIVYRLLYEDAGKPQSYSMSRWAAEPASLIADRLRSRLAAVTRGVVSPAFGARSDYTLRIELEDFSQQFKAPGQSAVLLRARASLLESEGRVLLAQRAFEVERAAQPNAPGAVKALAEATDAFLDELLKWIAVNAKK
jgi:cholesterol transport system auxiliary component